MMADEGWGGVRWGPVGWGRVGREGKDAPWPGKC